jgi:hypothetical protein
MAGLLVRMIEIHGEVCEAIWLLDSRGTSRLAIRAAAGVLCAELKDQHVA